MYSHYMITGVLDGLSVPLHRDVIGGASVEPSAELWVMDAEVGQR